MNIVSLPSTDEVNKMDIICASLNLHLWFGTPPLPVRKSVSQSAYRTPRPLQLERRYLRRRYCQVSAEGSETHWSYDIC